MSRSSSPTGVFAENVVADVGVGHRLPHGVGGLGDGVTAEVDHVSPVYLFPGVPGKR